eukprot:1193943-Prorocentrum_minimum.AAC.1
MDWSPHENIPRVNGPKLTSVSACACLCVCACVCVCVARGTGADSEDEKAQKESDPEVKCKRRSYLDVLQNHAWCHMPWVTGKWAEGSKVRAKCHRSAPPGPPLFPGRPTPLFPGPTPSLP